MALSAACCLRYAWWAACYSEWYGLPSYAEQLGMAAARASFYLRITITLQAATLAVVWSDQAAPYRPVQLLRSGARLGASVAITIAGTSLFVWLLSWARSFHIR